MDQVKKKSERRRKERYGRLHLIYLLLGVLVTGVIISFLLISTPLLNTVFPLMDESSSAGGQEAPSISMNSYLKSAGMDASEELQVMTSEVHCSGSRSWVTGKIKNTGNVSYQGFAVYFDLYDSAGQFVGSSYTLMGEIRPGESKKFDTNQVSGTASSAKLKQVIGGKGSS